MQCAVCHAENPDGNQFCGKCGNGLNATAEAVDRQVQKILAERFKERGLVEYEVSDKLVNRFTLLFKTAAWVFAPSLAVLAVALAIVGSLGFKTYTDATTTIKNAADVAVRDVQGKAHTAVNSIDDSSKQAQRMLNGYANSPELKRTIEAVETQAKIMNARVAAVSKAADENQKKLSDLAIARLTNPDVPIGRLSSAAFTPSDLSFGGSSDLIMKSSDPNSYLIGNLSRTYKVGSSGNEVKTIQNRLKQRDCYGGEITGTFDATTEQAVIAYKRARASTSTFYPFSSNASSSYDGTVDFLLFSELDSPLLMAMCPRK